MSSKVYRRGQKRWYSAVHQVIVANIREKITTIVKDRRGNIIILTDEEKLHQQWRLGYNLFASNSFYEALDILEKVCANGEKGLEDRKNGIESISKDSNHHLIAGRCCVELFLITNSHYHLESAYRHFQNSIERLPVDLTTMFKLPAILFEFGRMLELYGSFEAAMDLYSRILTNFPNYRGYFDVMYRSAIVGKYIADITVNAKDKEDTLNKCIDIFQFLLEALPLTINDVHVVFMYARSLEVSANPAIRYRSTGAYQGLYEYCKLHCEPSICNTDNYEDFKSWLNDPITFLSIGDHASIYTEPLICKDAYEKYVGRLQQEHGIRDFNDMIQYIELEVALKIAKNYAIFQNYNLAVKYGEISLKHNRLHKETRICMSKWSKIYEKTLRKEKTAVNTLRDHWRNRAWSQGFIKKLKNNIIQEMENKLQINHWRLDTRDQLAYYGRDKWRAKFMFEDECARRVQRLFRRKKTLWAWQHARRAQQLKKTGDVYQMYLRNKYDYNVRMLVREVCNHRFTPRKHIIHRVRLVIDEQDEAASIIRKCYKAYSIRQAIRRCIKRRREELYRANTNAAIVIQANIRRKLAYRARRRMIIRWKACAKAAKIVQKFIRWRNGTFQHSVTRVLTRMKDKRRKAMKTMRHIFLHKMRAYMKYIKHKRLREIRNRQLLEEKKLKEETELRFAKAIRIIKRCFYRIRDKTMSNIALKIFKSRRNAEFSIVAAKKLKSMIHDVTVRYKNPGVRQNTPQYIEALGKTALYCPGYTTNDTNESGPEENKDGFTHVDSLMLSILLKHRYCNLQQLMLHDIQDGDNPSYQFDLLLGIGHCKSLKSVYILGGNYSEEFIMGALAQVQIENAAIKELFIENVYKQNKDSGAHKSYYGKDIALGGGRLLCDFFNYSLPGIVTLSLHGCYIKDEDLELMCNGLTVNTSLQRLILSRNLITDSGFNNIFRSIQSNTKNAIKYLDFGWNLISCRKEMCNLLDNYISISTEDCLHVSLVFNLIMRPYHPPISVRRRIEIIVDCNDLHPISDTSAAKAPSVQSIPDTEVNKANNKTKEFVSPKRMLKQLTILHDKELPINVNVPSGKVSPIVRLSVSAQGQGQRKNESARKK